MNERCWSSYRWKLIHGRPELPATQMALDEVLTRRVGAGQREPTIRFWKWARPAVIIGRFQSVRNEVNQENARALGVDIVRRITGGGAMYVEPPNAITYSIYAPPALVAGLSFIESYAFLDEWAVAALRSLGIDAWYEPINDVTSSAGKIGGAAQARRFGAVLHHTTMAYDMNSDRMLQILRIGQEKLSDKGIASAAKRVAPLRLQTNLPRETIIDHMVWTFAEHHGLASLEEDELRPDELAEAEELARARFGTHEWTHILP